MKEKEEIQFSKAAFYAVLYSDFRKAALDCGYALALHGSMARDMDILAVAWVEDAKTHEELAESIFECIGDTDWKEHYKTTVTYKPHGRVAYTLHIMGDYFIDLSIIPPFDEDDSDFILHAY